jgi:hypothetical protein
VRIALAIAIAAACLCTTAVDAKSSHGSSSHHSSSSSHGHSKADAGVKRDSHGRIARSEKAKHEFRKTHPCPARGKTTGACPGYVIDHTQALKHGGADESYNMQWQTEAEARQKDKWE